MCKQYHAYIMLYKGTNMVKEYTWMQPRAVTNHHLDHTLKIHQYKSFPASGYECSAYVSV